MPVYALPGHEFIEFTGPDTREFLQGQVSCNIDQLTESRSLPGAICNLKGRVIADFRLAQVGGACIMQTSAGMAETIIATLSRYAVFSKVELRRIDPPLVLGLCGGGYGPALARLFPEAPATDHGCAVSKQMCLLRLPGERFELWCVDAGAVSPLRELFGEWQPSPGADWLAADIEAGVVHVTPAMSGHYTPHLLNYDLSGAVNFSKGCYTGQEVVARMHFRGKPKKRLFLFESEQPLGENSVLAAQAGGPEAGGEPLLVYVNRGVYPDGDTSLALAVASIEAVKAREPFFLDGSRQAKVFGYPLKYGGDAPAASHPQT